MFSSEEALWLQLTHLWCVNLELLFGPRIFLTILLLFLDLSYSLSFFFNSTLFYLPNVALPELLQGTKTMPGCWYEGGSF